ncbi:MAG: NAD-dependent epimerase/dehydratase family protein, partial [Bacillota bacterium]
MTVLVTGGAGFIASNIVDQLIEAGHQVIIVDNLSSGKKENLNPEAIF